MLLYKTIIFIFHVLTCIFMFGMKNIIFQRDDLKAIYWLNMCREYQPNQVACALLLCQLYIRLGQLNPALKALDLVLTTERGADNRLSEQLGTWECDVPAMAADILSKKAQAQQSLSAGEAMHFFVLVCAFFLTFFHENGRY